MRLKGFSLIEMLFVLLLVSVLVAIAYPSYQSYILRSKQQAAKLSLLRLASKMEQYAITHGGYEGASLVALGEEASNRDYQLQLSELSKNKFVVKAVPQTVLARSDTRCGAFILNNVGQHSVTGSDSASECW